MRTKELLRWNEKHFSSFLKGFQLQKSSQTWHCNFKPMKHSLWVICKEVDLKLMSTVYCIICFLRTFQKAFLSWLCQYLSFLGIFFNRFFPVEKMFINWLCLSLSFRNIFFQLISLGGKVLGYPLLLISWFINQIKYIINKYFFEKYCLK